MQPNEHFADIPLHLQKELRARLTSLHVKLTLASEQLRAEQDPARRADLREQIRLLKAEAQQVVDRYRDAGPGAAAEQVVESPDGFLVFPELEAAAAPAEPPVARDAATQPLSLDDLAIVFDAEVLAAPAAPWPSAPDPLERGGAVLDEVEITLALGSEEIARPQAARARGGRVGEALAYAAEAAGAARPGEVPRALARALEAAAMAIEAGAAEEEVVAAALGDAVSGPDDDAALAEIGDLFGEWVARLVARQALLGRIDPWEQRDRGYVATIAESPGEAVRNAMRARVSGVAALARRWSAPGAPAPEPKALERLVWTLKALGRAYRAAGAGPLADAWDRAVADLERAARRGP